MSDTFDLDDLLDGVDNVEDEIEDVVEDVSRGESLGGGNSKLLTGSDKREIDECLNSRPVPGEMTASDSSPMAPVVHSSPIDGGSLDHLVTCDCPQCKHDLEPLPVAFDSPHRPMTRRETLLLAYAFPAKVGETTEEISYRTGIPVPTIYRYKRREDFQSDLAEITRVYLADHRRKVADALIEGAITPGKGQAGMQRIYWQKLGELVDARSLQHKIEDPDEILSRVLGVPRDRLPE